MLRLLFVLLAAPGWGAGARGRVRVLIVMGWRVSRRPKNDGYNYTFNCCNVGVRSPPCVGSEHLLYLARHMYMRAYMSHTPNSSGRGQAAPSSCFWRAG